MSKLMTRDWVNLARHAGYNVIAVEQVRPNRWLLTLTSRAAEILLMVQVRPLITAADVQDLATMVQVRNTTYGMLLAYGGHFSPMAHQTHTEMNRHLYLCSELPTADQFALQHQQ